MAKPAAGLPANSIDGHLSGRGGDATGLHLRTPRIVVFPGIALAHPYNIG
jgi:hypothetical protein